MIGIQREFEIQQKKKIDAAGLRTFILIALFGALTGFVSNQFLKSYTLLIISFLSIVAIVIASYIAVVFLLKEKAIGITTEISTFMTFVLGAMCMLSYTLEAVIIAIIVLIFLALKKPLHEFVGKIKMAEVYATIKFAVITSLILPFLPNRNFTPMDLPIFAKIIEVLPFISVETAQKLDVFNPFKIWLMVVFISGISFIGYILIRIIGTGKGLGLTGMLGGLISSTAVTSSMALESKKTSKIVLPFVLAVVIACSTMFFRVIIEILFINVSLLKFASIPLLIMGAAGYISSFIIWKRIKEQHTRKMEFNSPFTLRPALKFALFFAFVLFISKLGSVVFGAKGVYIAALVAGLADVDAITLSMATIAAAGDISAIAATIAITIAAITNTIVKGSIAYIFGANKFRKKTLIILGIILFFGLLSIVVFLLPKI